jgi:methyl-accepting chemotaxis protein
MGKNRRRWYFEKKYYQTRFIARFVIVTTIWSIVAASLFAYIAGKRLEATMYSSHLSVASADDLLIPSAMHAQGLALLPYVLLLAYAIHDLGKRISAPLFMLKQDITRLGSGDLVDPVTLRPEDEFQDMAADLDAMRLELSRRFSRIKEKHEELAQSVFGLDRAFLQGHPLTENIKEIRTAAARMKEELKTFTW